MASEAIVIVVGSASLAGVAALPCGMAMANVETAKVMVRMNDRILALVLEDAGKWLMIVTWSVPDVVVGRLMI